MSRREKTGNWILDALPDEEFEPLEKGMDRVELVETETLLAPDRPSSWAYFPTSGVISFLRGFNDGAQVEVGVIGREGMVGLHVILEPELEP
ncbi:MAG: Crp/Fnr family transcriptional regulator, partial [Acidobacteria bacterium]|nr:Crp/Fnr family transcriptional regulator [Acidobacteriota bacterium]